MEEFEGASSSSQSVVSGEIEGIEGDKRQKRKNYLAKRDATKVCLYEEQFARWRRLKDELGVKTDKEVAALLLDNYFDNARQVIATTRYKISIV